MKFITEHAEQFDVQTEDYALVGFSSGGQIVGTFANKKHGYGYYNVQKPGALLLAYPIVDLTVMKPVYQILCDTTDYTSWKYYWTNLNQAVDADYPPVYFWRGDNDTSLGSASVPGQHNDFAKTLEKNNIPYVMVKYKNAPHSIGTGNGTDAEGWVRDAADFWEAQTQH